MPCVELTTICECNGRQVKAPRPMVSVAQLTLDFGGRLLLPHCKMLVHTTSMLLTTANDRCSNRASYSGNQQATQPRISGRTKSGSKKPTAVNKAKAAKKHKPCLANESFCDFTLGNPALSLSWHRFPGKPHFVGALRGEMRVSNQEIGSLQVCFPLG